MHKNNDLQELINKLEIRKNNSTGNARAAFVISIIDAQNILTSKTISGWKRAGLKMIIEVRLIWVIALCLAMFLLGVILS